MAKVQDIIQLFRVRQWTKNILVLVPAFFAGSISKDNWLTLILGFIVFCCASSIIYIINDWLDKEADKLHPKKKNRPFPREAISPQLAIVLIIILAALIPTLGILLPTQFMGAIALIVLLNLFYSIGLKRVPYLELLVVAFGFLIRIYAGGYLVFVPISFWLSSLIATTALLIVCAKRNAEIQQGNLSARKVLKHYNPTVMMLVVILLSILAVIVYFMYCLDPEVIERIGSDKLYITSIFILLGMARYLQQIFIRKNADAPAELFYKDKVIFIIILCWLSSFYYFLYAN